jgi:hypothetical protein
VAGSASCLLAGVCPPSDAVRAYGPCGLFRFGEPVVVVARGALRFVASVGCDAHGLERAHAASSSWVSRLAAVLRSCAASASSASTARSHAHLRSSGLPPRQTAESYLRHAFWLAVTSSCRSVISSPATQAADAVVVHPFPAVGVENRFAQDELAAVEVPCDVGGPVELVPRVRGRVTMVVMWTPGVGMAPPRGEGGEHGVLNRPRGNLIGLGPESTRSAARRCNDRT